jgi:hypothetical protein
MPKLGKTSARGYGARHQAERAKAKRLVDAGLAYCWRCGGWIPPGTPFDLGHDDQDRSVYRGPEHRGRECPAGGNRATSGRRGRRGRRVTRPRRWIL